MSIKKTLGGDRLGSGKKMQVDLHNYERSTFDLSYVWRSTMSAGTLVPFICEVGLPGDSFDINLDLDAMTLPTSGPALASYKVQCDTFVAPIRLYQGLLHNNKIGIGMNMNLVKLPKMTLSAISLFDAQDIDNAQINPSCILSYLGIRGVGDPGSMANITRTFNAVPLLLYWDIYKNYYSNKMEERGAVIHSVRTVLQTVTAVQVDSVIGQSGISQFPNQLPRYISNPGSVIKVTFSGVQVPPAYSIIFTMEDGQLLSLLQLCGSGAISVSGNVISGVVNRGLYPDSSVLNWNYLQPNDAVSNAPEVSFFPLENIDTMKENVIAAMGNIVDIGGFNLTPYSWVLGNNGSVNLNMEMSQEGLGIKTFQSDLFNNWLSTDWIDGTGGITAVTSIDTSGGSFSLDTLNLSKKVYELLNRIAVSGGTYNDWLDAVYMNDRATRIESPMYTGGLIKELVFADITSTAASPGMPLASLAGKGVMANKHKGGYVNLRIDEPSYVMGIVSITPRVDYSQGNKWDVHLDSIDDLHKPQLDGIGFQELITEQMAWWDTSYDLANATWVQRSAGKQPAWINYMSNVNRCYGNFAVADNQMFMTLNRRYERGSTGRIKDLTTYIDPSKFNYLFADSSIDAQNFWVQIKVDMSVRRKMSSKIMPNL